MQVPVCFLVVLAAAATATPVASETESVPTTTLFPLSDQTFTFIDQIRSALACLNGECEQTTEDGEDEEDGVSVTAHIEKADLSKTEVREASVAVQNAIRKLYSIDQSLTRKLKEIEMMTTTTASSATEQPSFFGRLFRNTPLRKLFDH